MNNQYINNWKENELIFLKENYNKLPNKLLAKEIGRTQQAINRKAQRLKLKKIGEAISFSNAYWRIGKPNLSIKGEKNPRFNPNLQREYGFDFTKELKTLIRKRDNFTCQCGKNGFLVHHIDHNKKNNSPDNLITLCRSCHMKHHQPIKYKIEYVG